jgi:hypothetical protein
MQLAVESLRGVVKLAHMGEHLLPGEQEGVQLYAAMPLALAPRWGAAA